MRKLIFTIFFFSLGQIYAQDLDSKIFSQLEFRSIGPATMSGRIVDLEVLNNDPSTFWVASATGGVWKTTNRGVTYTSIFQNEATHSVGDIAVHQSNPKFIWVGTGERANRQSSSWGDGVYLSKNGGRTWENVGLKDSKHIGRIVLHPTDTNTAYVAAMGHLWGPNEERGLYITRDGGQTWKRTLYIDEDTGVVDIAMHPDEPSILYAATYQRRRKAFGFHGGGPGSGLYKSIDGGKSWRELTEGLPEGDYGRIGIDIYKQDPNIVYICLEQGYQYNASTAYNRRKGGVYRSEDKGESWTFMSDWNPRPMYASQIKIDPNNDQRIYMVNSFSYSNDGGKTFRSARQSLHGDDRFVWINPNNSDHVMKADDGGLGISYDKARTWLYIENLPISQFYRVGVDMQKPYRVYGGLQDNGSWMGPSETYRSEGILNSDWVKIGGGDGFKNQVSREDDDLVFTESQYLGLSLLNTRTMQRRTIRPGDPKGHISARRNWDAWGPGKPEPELGNAMAPANWDGPFHLSVHSPTTIYAGTNKLWKSTDNGGTWTDLGDLTTKVNRRNLKIMGQRADTITASLDDGIPYYPTLTEIVESPLRQGVLYVGTDDGKLNVSMDDGSTWTDVIDRLSGLPGNAWISGIEASRFEEGRAYVAINNYRNDDYGNYLYVTEDFGKTWTPLTSDLPEDRVLRTVREDTRNPEILYLGTELGLFITLNRGKNWIELKNNMPTMAINDLVIHPRDNDLVLGTHSRGIWILDDLTPIQQLSPDSETELFDISDAEMINYTREGGHRGDMFFQGENPARGAVIDYYLKDAVDREDINLVIMDKEGQIISNVDTDTTSGINRITWNFTGRELPTRPTNPYDSSGANRRFGWRRGGGIPVLPGEYLAKLTVNGKSYTKNFMVHNDPRADIGPGDLEAWNTDMNRAVDIYARILRAYEPVQKAHWKIEYLKEKKTKLDEKATAEISEINDLFSELSSRAISVIFEIRGWQGPMTTDQAAQIEYFGRMVGELQSRSVMAFDQVEKRINKKLPDEDKIDLAGGR